jgi:hypothetical protein
MIGTLWIAKSSVPLWQFNEIGYIIKIARIDMGSLLLVTKDIMGESPLIHVIWNGIEGCIFYSDLKSFCTRIY